MYLLTSVLMFILCISCSHGNAVWDIVHIECDGNPVTGMVNVTYFGEADMMYPMNNRTVITTCKGEYRVDGTFVLEDVNHRDCAFTKLRHTNTYTIKIKIQKKRQILTALDKEFYLSCVYDKYKDSKSIG